ncbi:MAG TPA: hypothetical protein VFG24_00685 [Nitrosopumilaceae archaeon]|nr:hypothetical protein [Nitrosopumilaceae archaeon]
MKTLHLSIITITGILLLIIGALTLVVRIYLDELDQEIAKSYYISNCPNASCPFAPQPYWEIIPIITYIGIAFCCVGIFVLAYKKIKIKIEK